MKRNIHAALDTWIQQGFRQIGQIVIHPQEHGYALTHEADTERTDLAIYTRATDARKLSTLDEHGVFRPIKTAPTLKRGWKLLVPDLAQLRLALDAFYPAMLGSFFSYQTGQLPAVPLRETLNRQSGMYAVTKKLTDPQANTLVGECCNSQSGCLKLVLWRISEETAVTSLPPSELDPAQSPQSARGIPLLCAEACNLLVAKAREVVKKSPPTG
jgi:sirohydrochlorin cobaltochelatase